MLSTFAVASTNVDALCAPMQTNPSTFLENSQLDVSLLSVLNSKMCSEDCPCPMEAKAIYDQMTDSDLEYYLRDSLFFTSTEQTFETF